MNAGFRGYVRNAGKRWRSDDVKRLRQLARRGLDVRAIGLEIGRPDAAVRSKLRDIGWTAGDRSPVPGLQTRTPPVRACAPGRAATGQLELF